MWRGQSRAAMALAGAATFLVAVAAWWCATAGLPRSAPACATAGLPGSAVDETAALLAKHYPQRTRGDLANRPTNETPLRFVPNPNGPGFVVDPRTLAQIEKDARERLKHPGWHPIKPEMYVRPVLPQRFAEPVQVASQGHTVGARPVGANAASAPRVTRDGSLVYPDAFPGCDVAYRCSALKTEEFIVIRWGGRAVGLSGERNSEQLSAQNSALRTFTWDLDVPPALKPRVTPAHTIEFVNFKGVPRLRINAPEGKDADCTLLRAGERLALTLDGSRVTLVADVRGLKLPVVIDPSWSSTGAMTSRRQNHTATLLGNGRVLVAGGYTGVGNAATCEVYNPAAGTWSATGSMASVRNSLAAVLLADGRVLVAGGDNGGIPGAVSACQLWNPANGQWTATGSMSSARRWHTLTRFNDGSVLAAGGENGSVSVASCDLYSPGAGTWAPTGSMSIARDSHTATLLQDGRALLVGGERRYSAGPFINTEYLSSCTLYDPKTGTWSMTGDMGSTRYLHTATLLGDGRALVAGGGSAPYYSSCLLYDPATGNWSGTGAMTIQRSNHAAAVLGNGTVLVTGGYNGSYQASTEALKPSDATWASMGSMAAARSCHTLTRLDDGTLLVTGGSNGACLDSCERLDRRPTATPQSVSILEDRPATITLRAVSLDTPTFTVIARPAHGTLSGTPPTLAYAPDTNYWGTDTFDFTATDCFGTSPSARVAINITQVNDPPTLDLIADVNLLEDAGTRVVTLTGISPGLLDPPQNLTLAVDVASDPNGVTASASFQYANPNTSATVFLSLVPNASGSARLRVTLSDDGGTANGGINTFFREFNVNVAPVNDPPTFTAGQSQAVDEDSGPQTVTSWATNISAGPPDEVAAGQTCSFIVFNNNNALFSVQPAVSSGGALTYTPAPNASGSATVMVQLKDDGGTANGGVDISPAQTFMLTVNPINDAPVAYDQSIVANESQPKAIALTASDPDGGETLTYTIVTPPAYGTLTGTPPNVTYTSSRNPAATDSFGFKVTDNGTPGLESNVATVTISINLVNDPPTADNQSVSTAEDQPIEIALQASDPENDPLSYAVLSSPVHGTLSAITQGNKVVYAPSLGQTGVVSFSFKANDGKSDSNVATVTINVSAGTVPSVASLSQTSAVVGGPGFTLTLEGSNFAANAVVLWNGSPLPTARVSSTQLTAAIGTANLTTPGRVDVSVLNQPPGGGASAALPFYIYSGTAVGTWVVTNTLDEGPGSLRQAMQCARSGDTILFDANVFALANSDAATVINVLSELPPLAAGNVTIDAQDRRVTVNGSGAGSANGIVIASSGNTVMGLAVVGFTRSGICIRDGAKSNIVGGNRQAGTGPNGQGLRIGNNGSFGIQISGLGTDGNIVKGCWIGLGASGKDMHGNLAGVLIEGGAKANIIGGTSAGERNAISGNLYEGITVSGDGTDDNVIVGNIIGAAGLAENAGGRAAGLRGEEALQLGSRMPVANGSAGVFLSQGTTGTRVGGEDAADANLIAHNGGSGLEVRTPGAKHNSSRGNRISKNTKGGIALYDGSNEGLKAPAFTSVERLPARAAVAARGVATVRVAGTASVRGGTVEVFTDPEYQGGTLAGRCPVVNGTWQIEVDVSDVENLTATLTDGNGNTSPFAFFGRAPGLPPPPDDTPGDADGDGVSDILEALAGTDPDDASDVPVQAGAVVVDKLSVGLSFVSATRDSIKATLRLVLPDGYTNSGAVVSVMFADYSERLTGLDAKGNSPKGDATVKVIGAPTTPGPTTGGLLQFSAKGRDFEAGLASAGLTNRTTAGKTGETLPLPVAVTLATADGRKYVYIGSVNVVYKAVQGKCGKANKAR